MIERMIEFSARNKYIMLIVAAVAVVCAVYVLGRVPLDAIPDLSDTQVIIYSRWDRSPDIIEDQVTYPIVSAMLGTPKVKAIRGFSDFGYSYVYVIFQDGTDLYWARSRALEYLSKIQPRLPAGVSTELGPDATAVGWVYEYSLIDTSGSNNLQQLRSFQDWYLRYWLQSVPGVAEVASIGGFQKQYQINIDPNALVAYDIPLPKVIEAVRGGNNDVGGRLVEFSGAEYMVRGRGYAKSIQDIENVGVGFDKNGTPVYVKNIGRVTVGPDIRRGVADLDGMGDTVGGVVVMRQGENALNVITRVKQKIEEIKPSLPKGMEIIPTYDRSRLINESVDTLTHELIAALIIVSFIILIFLWHIPSAIVPIVTIPISVLLAFIPMYLLGINVNIMSISGIAISIGVLVDGAIVEVENAYKRLEKWQEEGRKGDFHVVRLAALKEVGPSVFFSLLVIAVAFLPIFALEEQAGRLFKPLAYTKTLTMGIAAILAVTLDPAVRMMFARMNWRRFRPRPLAWLYNQVTVGRYYPEEKHPISRLLFALYDGPCRLVIKWPLMTVAIALILVGLSVPAFFKLGSEFMPPLWEGDILYMPTTMPGISVTEAARLMQQMDLQLKAVPEVVRVFGKAGRVESSTDPAPFSMMETTILLKPPSEWRPKEMFYSKWPEWMRGLLRHIWPDHISKDELIADLDARMKFPGAVNAWTMPIKTRIDMLSTGIRTPIGIKVGGADLKVIQDLGVKIEGIMRSVPGTRSVLAERTSQGYFLDFTIRRDQLARYGLAVDEANEIIMSAIGGQPVTTTVEGRERYTVSVRYARELRSDLAELRRVLVCTSSGMHIPLEELADISYAEGPSMIRDEDGLLTGYVYVDTIESDIGGYVKRAKAAVERGLVLPAGYSVQWSGQYESMIRVNQRLKVIVPITLFLIFVLLYMNTKSAVKATIVMLAVPFSAIGAIWLLYFLGYNVSIAVWVGLIALMGLDAETGVFMLLFLDLSHDEFKEAGRLRTEGDLVEAIIHGAVKRVRPKVMTVACAFFGLLPIMWSLGTGADVMKRIAAPMVGGLFTSFIMELLVYPVIYELWKRREVESRKT
jgi:copper/silver efflux system protein